MFPLYQTSGFYAAPVSKALVGGSVLSSIIFNFPFNHLRHWFQFTPSDLFDNYDFIRYVICRCVFLDPKDLMCAGIILYHFRVFERRYGSRKFVNFLLCNMFVSQLLEIGFLYVFRDFDLDPMPSGPYGIVFSLYLPFLLDIPRVPYTHVMGIPVTGKSLTYIIGLQLTSGSIESMILAVIGLLSGVIVRTNILWIQSWFRIPKFLAKLSHHTLGWLLHTAPPSEPDIPLGATIEIQRQQQIEQLEQQMAWAQLQPQRNQGPFGFNLFGNAANIPLARNNGRGVDVVPPQMAAPSDDQVQRLVEMGFNRDNVMNALRASNNNINVATNILLHET